MSVHHPIADMRADIAGGRPGAAFQLPQAPTRERRCSLSHRGGCASTFSDWRRVPLPRERVRLWTVEAHRQIEWPIRRGNPIPLFVCPRIFVLEVKVDRAVRIIFVP